MGKLLSAELTLALESLVLAIEPLKIELRVLPKQFNCLADWKLVG